MNIQVKYIDTMEYIATVRYDDCESPAEWGNFNIVTFNPRWTTYKPLDDITTESGKLTPAFQAKLKAGKVFWLDIYEHGGVSYRLSGEGMQDRFDTTSRGGYIELFYEFKKGTKLEEKQDIARQDLEEYTSWANGETYSVTIEDKAGNFVDSLGGIIGYNMVADTIHDMLPDAENVTVEEDF